MFGWEFIDYSPIYVGIKGVNGEVGGFTEVADIKKVGGTVVKEIFSFPGRERFHFLDTGGNELAVW